MTLDRRRFVALAGALAAHTAGWPRPASAAGDAPSAATRSSVDADGTTDWHGVRALFDLDPRWIHLATFFLASHPRPVRDAIERYRRRLDANPLWIEEALVEPGDELRALRTAVGGYLGCGPDDFALMENTTGGLSMVYNGLPLGPGLEILTTEHDHYAHHAAITLAAEKRGAAVRRIPLYDPPAGRSGGAAHADADQIVERLRRAISPATRAVGVTWVHSSTGLKLPIARLAEVVRAANATRDARDRCLLIVDGVHGLGVEDQTIADLGADFFAAGTHKWLFGPRGTGVLWARADAWPLLRPTIPSFEAAECWDAWMAQQPFPPTRASFLTRGGFLAFEHLFALPAAIELHRRIGRSRIAARIAELNGRFREALGAMPKVTLHTPRDPALASGIVAFEIDGLKPREIVTRLAAQRIHATESPYAVPYARVSAGIMVQPAEVETAIGAIRAIAS